MGEIKMKTVIIVLDVGTTFNMKEEFIGAFKTRQDAENYMRARKEKYTQSIEDKEEYVWVHPYSQRKHSIMIIEEEIQTYGKHGR